MDTLLDIGPALVAARLAQGVTQHELGKRTGVSQQQIARWESRSYAHVDLERVSAVARALGVEPRDLSTAFPIAAEPMALYEAASITTTPRIAPRLEFSQSELEAICRRRAVRRLALFGSVLGDDFGPDSDVDVLVEFDHGAFEGKEVHRLPGELSELFGGRKVDLVEAEFVSGRLRQRIMSEASYVFTA